jgi:hypothetical protein
MCTVAFRRLSLNPAFLMFISTTHFTRSFAVSEEERSRGCSGNVPLLPSLQSVFVEHHDVREPRLFLVAMQNIKPLEVGRPLRWVAPLFLKRTPPFGLFGPDCCHTGLLQ